MSKIAIISDIHSNPSALKTVLKDAEDKRCSRIICLGDIVGYGYDPNGCIEICKEAKIECLLGNHDAGLVGSFSLDLFNPFASKAVEKQRLLVSYENKEWIRTLPYTAIEPGIFKKAFSHGTLDMPERFDYIQYYSDAAFEFPNLVSQGIRVLFVGHTHCANAYLYDSDDRISETYIDIDDEVTIDLKKWKSAIINVGSVGYPRNQPYTIYGIYDTKTHVFRHRILPFDFDDYISQMKKGGAEIPYWVEDRKAQSEERQIGFR